MIVDLYTYTITLNFTVSVDTKEHIKFRLKFGDPNAVVLIVKALVHRDGGRQDWSYDLEREFTRVSSGKMKFLRIGLAECADR